MIFYFFNNNLHNSNFYRTSDKDRNNHKYGADCSKEIRTDKELSDVSNIEEFTRVSNIKTDKIIQINIIGPCGIIKERTNEDKKEKE